MAHASSKSGKKSVRERFVESNFGCLVGIACYFVGMPLVIFGVTAFLTRRYQQFFINLDHDADAYGQGVRFVFKGPELTDGTTLGWPWFDLYLLCTVASFFVVCMSVACLFYCIFDPKELRPKANPPRHPK